jgi:nicotinate-nucleotide adenylyltransferase
MKIGILGGSFDPPHIGHLLVARQTREIFGLDEVWLMPYFAHNWDKNVASASDRLAMAKMLEEEGIRASDVEIVSGHKNYTIETVAVLKRLFQHNFYWIVGSDILSEFKRWKEADQLTKEVKFLVFPRTGHDLTAPLPPGFTIVNSPELATSNFSSTLIRKRLAKGLSVSGLIPGPVLDYIHLHGLYK